MRQPVKTIVAFACFLAAPVMAFADPTSTGSPAEQSSSPGPITVPTQPAPPAPQQTSSTTSDLDQIVCKAGTPTVGTRFAGSRQCHTQRQWDQLRQDSQRALIKAQLVGKGGGN
jgi:hypothetical protein